jgi:hypothetical protein
MFTKPTDRVMQSYSSLEGKTKNEYKMLHKIYKQEMLSQDLSLSLRLN